MAHVPLRVSGECAVPGDKSISHRALIFGALATGTSRVGGILQSADVQATAECLRSFGWDVPALAPTMQITGAGFRAPFSTVAAPLECNNSGTTARLLAGIAAAQPLTTEFRGDRSLTTRPMSRVSEPLQAMGARFEWLGESGRLPMRIVGGELHALSWASTLNSAQVKSAILLAGLCAGARVSVAETIQTRDHTERLLRLAGADIEAGEGTVSLGPTSALAPVDLVVPGDPSSAAFFVALAAGASAGMLRLCNVLLNPLRTGFLRVLERMGARIEVENERDSGGERVGDLVVRPAPLRGTVILPGEVPSLVDEIPVLAALAVVAEGETRVTGAQELRVKESDRISAMVSNLRRCAVDAEEIPDGLVVRGCRAPRAANVETRGDHRIAMSFGVLAALTGIHLQIDDPGCVSVSYPTFWSDLARVTR